MRNEERHQSMSEQNQDAEKFEADNAAKREQGRKDADKAIAEVANLSPQERIEALEAKVTNRRLREALLTGVESGTFVESINEAISSARKERAA